MILNYDSTTATVTVDGKIVYQGGQPIPVPTHAPVPTPTPAPTPTPMPAPIGNLTSIVNGAASCNAWDGAWWSGNATVGPYDTWFLVDPNAMKGNRIQLTARGTDQQIGVLAWVTEVDSGNNQVGIEQGLSTDKNEFGWGWIYSPPFHPNPILVGHKWLFRVRATQESGMTLRWIRS